MNESEESSVYITDQNTEVPDEETSGEFQIYNPHSRKSRLKRIFAIAFPFVNLAVAGVIIFLAMRTDDVSTSDIFSVSVNWLFLFVALLVVIVIILLESGRWQLSMYTMTKRFQPFLCLRTYLLERHYNLLTPFHTGGKAYQLYYLHKHKFSAGEITAIAISNFILGRVGFQLVTGIIIAVLMSRLSALDGGMVVTSAIYISIVFNVILTFIILFISFNKTIPHKVSMLCVFILHKMRIIKNHKAAKHATEETLWRYRVTVRKLVRSPKVVLASITLASIAQFLNLFIIALIYAALFGWSWSVLPLLLLGVVLTEYTASTMPVPGGTGAMELFFLSIFATTFGTPQIFVALVLWKVFSYIIPILTGVPVIAYDNIKKFRLRRQHKT
ncbi:MAG: flippase-like domain-containing protein [Firmicutes bacterium]|nr:flippase-like domain-containing protein [Bacillota bacterium]